MSPGFIFAALTILFFGSWAVPTKTLKNDPYVMAFWLTLGHFILSILIFIFTKVHGLRGEILLAPLIAGILWAIGIASGYVGIKHLGITRALGTWVPLIIIISALWGLVFFGEAKVFGTQKSFLTVLAIILLVFAALAIVFSAKSKKEILGNVKLGIIASVILALFHGSFFVPLRTINESIFITFVPLTFGMILTTFVITFLKKLNIFSDLWSTLRMTLAGLILGGGNYCALLTIQFLGVSQGYPLTQLGIIVNTLWGTLVFKEVKSLQGKILIVIGVATAILGAIILNFARV